jgi:hypothetical protein
MRRASLSLLVAELKRTLREQQITYAPAHREVDVLAR